MGGTRNAPSTDSLSGWIRRHGTVGLMAALPLLAFCSLLAPARVQAQGDPAQSQAELAQAQPEEPEALTPEALAPEAEASEPESTEPQSSQPDPLDADQAPEPTPEPAELLEGQPEAPAGVDTTIPVSPPQTAPLTPGPGSLAPESPTEPKVLISEVVVEGLDGHPEAERLELAVYDAMVVRPGSRVSRSELQTDLAAIYASGWFSDVRIQPVDGPLGVQLVVIATANPVLQKVEFSTADIKLPPEVLEDTFAADFDRTLNLNTLQARVQELQTWYSDQGYSLARITGPSRVSPEGVVELTVREGTVQGVEVQFLNREGSATNDEGEPIRGKTKPWVVTREISTKPGEIFNRRNLEEDIKRLYGTGLFGDVKVTLRPVPATPGEVVIVLGMVEQSTGSLSGGLGYSQSQGVFGQIQLQDTNLIGRAWDMSVNFTYGQFGGLADISFTDPWIKGDKYRTAFRARLFISRDVPQIYQSQDNGNINTASDFYEAPSTSVAYNINSRSNPEGRRFDSVNEAEDESPGNSWFDYDGNSIAIQRVGGNIQFVRPLNSGDPFKRAMWNIVLGASAQEVRPINFAGESMPFGVSTNNFDGDEAPIENVVCVAFNCASSNQLVALRVAATRNTLNDPRNPTSGSFLSVSTEQFVSVGPDSPTFNRLRGSYSFFIPVNWLKFYRGCRPEPGEPTDCKQALAFQVTAGTNIGDLPPYEAFCLGGSNSVRGFSDCDLGVGSSFGEATIEYRFPLFSIISGQVFIDGGTTFGTQSNVQGNPGGLLNKPGSGFSVGTGLIVTTPVGPLRLEVASRDFSGDWRFNLGVGWKF
ncbi:BamA/TamA family outer membrane protein [Synechococcus sp. CS-602]|uniref:BamA/TamA family outer membrane protein n=1 Tax=Synechococcaceae TaxID=1890426 RepID=UPI0008FF697C|nr:MULTISPECIES: BamA/TamA family outer membrane protein [Synechococcaceae]MCT4364502.1 BamA/TamA family outer membrane protein [Candidatus Regnicoccus frigidus MAG-AL1]MCT0205308.1 BamA/TamA family outer membrane protein [Synechococcus sp. CS-602]MCT0246802.1 BamA/TamA family outer membrane protein [Synechococcus sp. CS-601]MCT4367895.1 BamA/TamA family outer membrane protein [Candidatus Regnicoccus frigidus MAG-AL2]TWB95047.1 outer membrane protein insertion porin family [Synechococcus sp. A